MAPAEEPRRSGGTSFLFSYEGISASALLLALAGICPKLQVFHRCCLMSFESFHVFEANSMRSSPKLRNHSDFTRSAQVHLCRNPSPHAEFSEDSVPEILRSGLQAVLRTPTMELSRGQYDFGLTLQTRNFKPYTLIRSPRPQNPKP